MQTLDIPGGQARLRDQDEIRVKHRRLIEAAAVAAASALEKLPSDRSELEQLKLQQLDLSRAEATALFELQDATIVATLIDWARPEPVPNLDTVGDMDPEVYEGLAAATRELGSNIASRVNFDPSDPKASGFDATPTLPSDGSATGSRADQASTSTETPSSTGTSTGSAAPSPE